MYLNWTLQREPPSWPTENRVIAGPGAGKRNLDDDSNLWRMGWRIEKQDPVFREPYTAGWDELSFSMLEKYMSHGPTQRGTDTPTYWRPRFQSQGLLSFKV